MNRTTITLFGIGSYLMFNAAFAYLAFFLLEIGVPKTINSGEPGNLALAAAINLGLIALFGITHSVMAREKFKAWWTQYIPPAAERSAYVFQSSFFLALIMWQWQPMPQVIWHVEGAAVWAFYAAFAAGAGILLWSTFLIDHFELFGLRQIWTNQTDKPMPDPQFRTPALYRIVRHPMQFGIMLMFAATPHMTVGHALFVSAMTGYILIGLYFEERSLVRVFGDRYRNYQNTVPMLIPFLNPRKPNATLQSSGT